ncbi:MAG: hypothetical protein ACTSXQ_02150 [Alphaproteobacteria bacterium]
MRFFYSFLILTALIGCAGNQNREALRQSITEINTIIVEEQTTKSDLLSTFGEPMDKSFDNFGNEQWVYVDYVDHTRTPDYNTRSDETLSDSSNIFKKVIVVFNDANVVSERFVTFD